MEILALDVGVKKTGIARASSEAKLAEPLKTIKTDQVLDQLKEILARQPVEAVVVGLPRNTGGQDTDQTRWVRQWVANVKSQISAPLYWQDEFLTTELAQAKKAKDTKGDTVDADAVAASIILEDFLATDKNARVLV